MPDGLGTCPRCGSALSGNAPGGMCAACLVRECLEKEPEAGALIEAHDPEWPAETGGVPTAQGGSRRFGDYELLKQIAHGGMGKVYKARQLSLNRIVALKTILTGLVENESQVKRFRAEAQAPAKLHHPNIVAIHEIGVCEGQHYFSMDFVEGQSLAQITSRNPLPPRKAAEYLRTVARAVDYAHHEGILHRDIKPSNILIEDATDLPRVTDFGLAKEIRGHSDLTLSGQVIGTASYMPPEQAAGKLAELGPWTDVYALGATLYETLTGKPPHRAPSTVATLKLVLETEPASPRIVNPGVPKDLETICLKCLAKEPDRRYQTAAALSEDLERFLKDEPILARPVSRTERTWLWCRRNPRTAGLVSAVGLLLLVILIGLPIALVRIHNSRDEALQYVSEKEEQRQAAETNLRRLELERARSLFVADNAPAALASLAALLRKDPSNTVVAEWIINELTSRNFALPIAKPMVHGDKVHFAQFSADSRRLVTASRANEARVWDALTGRPISPSLKHGHWVVERSEFTGGLHPLWARFSPDGRRVLTGSADNVAQVWDAETGQPVGAPMVHPNWVTDVTFSPDGSLVVTGCRDGEVQFWRSDNGEALGRVLRHASCVNSVEFSPDGRRLLTASDDRTARVWDVASREPVGEPLRHSQWVKQATFSPDSLRVATASEDGSAGLWDAATGKALIEPLRHAGPVAMVNFSPSGVWLVTASRDRTARIWDTRNGRLQGEPLQHKFAVRWAEFSPEGERVVTASEDRTARIWDAHTGAPLSEPLAHVDAVWCARFSPDGRYVATACSDGAARVWDALPGAAMPLVLDQAGVVTAVHWLPGSREVLAVGRHVEARDTATGKTMSGKYGFRSNLTGIGVSPDGSRLVTEVEEGVVQVWEPRKARILVRERLHQGAVTAVDFSPDGSLAVTASMDDTALLWDSRSGRPVAAPLRHPDDVLAAAFSPDARRVATAARDCRIRLWDVPGGVQVGPELALETQPRGLRFSGNGAYLAVAGEDGRALIWDWARNRMVVPPLRHHGPVCSVAFSRDDRWLLTASRDATARVWEVATGRPVSDLMRHEGPVNVAKFMPGERHVLTACVDGTAWVWNIRAGQPVWISPALAGQVNDVASNAEGTRIAVASPDRACYIYEFVRLTERASGWVANLAEVVAGQRVTAQGESEPVAWDESFRLRTTVSNTVPADSLSGWLQWFLADRYYRRMSPSVEACVNVLVEQWVDWGHYRTRESLADLRRGLCYEPNNGRVYAQAARVLASSGMADQPDRVEMVDFWTRKALALAPDDFLAWWARADYLELVGKREDAADVMEQAGRFQEKNFHFWLEWAWRLERAGRVRQAREIFTNGVQWARQMTRLGVLDEATASIIQLRCAQFLLRHGHIAEGMEGLPAGLRIPPREDGIPASLVDLTRVYNSGLTKGSSLISPLREGFEGLPLGNQMLSGVRFDIRGLVQLLSGPSKANQLDFPEKVVGIAVMQGCRRIHFVHAADRQTGEGTRIGTYVIRCGDGGTVEIPVVYGREVRAWNRPLEQGKPGPSVAWSGRNNSSLSVQLFLTTWENPRPEVPVEAIDLVSEMKEAAPFVVAITVE